MSNRTILIIVVALVLLTIVGIFLLNSGSRFKYNWQPRFGLEESEPYDISFIYNILQKNPSTKNFTKTTGKLSQVLIKNTTEVPVNYIAIAPILYLDSADVDELIRFVQNGNNVFISAESQPKLLLNQLGSRFCFPYLATGRIMDTAVNANFTHPNLETDTPYNYTFWAYNETRSYFWGFFEEYIPCTYAYSATPVGMANNEINFVKIKVGEGSFYFHANPIMFTNYFVKDEKGYEYATKAFSHLPEGDVIFDDFSTEYMPPPRTDGMQETPLQVLLSHPPLMWAWYLLLAMGLLYLLFRAKRRQRIIPVIEENKNTSLEFVETISRLYLQQRDHQRLAAQMMKQWQAWVQTRYGIAAAKADTDTMESLGTRSGIGKDRVRSIYKEYNKINSAREVDERALYSFNSMIKNFYKNAK